MTTMKCPCGAMFDDIWPLLGHASSCEVFKFEHSRRKAKKKKA